MLIWFFFSVHICAVLAQNLKLMIKITHINNIFIVHVTDSLVSYNALLFFQSMPMMVATRMRLQNRITRSNFNFNSILHTWFWIWPRNHHLRKLNIINFIFVFKRGSYLFPFLNYRFISCEVMCIYWTFSRSWTQGTIIYCIQSLFWLGFLSFMVLFRT